MLLKRFEGKTLQETLDRVRRDCGADALVVESRATRTGYLVVAARPDQGTGIRAAAAHARATPSWTRGFLPLAAKATDFGLSARLLHAVEDALLGTRVSLSRAGDPALPGLVARVLQSLIRTEPRCEGPAAGPFRTLAFVGPTGVGKTTTLAKLAARAVAAGQRVAILTLDTFRVAAVEQLRAFADLMDAPFEVAFTPQDLRRALQRHADADRVYVDTTGRSPLDRDGLAALRAALGQDALAAVLCLAAGTRRRDADVVADAFEPFAPDAVCLTKWDETTMPGESLSAVVERGLALCHLGTGQDVPAAILPACAAELAAAAFDQLPAGATP
jgi:flagellar biosynthesis protein FlhF